MRFSDSATKLRITDSRYLNKKFLYNAISALTSSCEGVNKVLDVGCGDAPYRHLFKSNTYIGVDLNLQESVLARTSGFIAASAEVLPVKSSYFDAVICTAVIMCTENPPNFLSEAYRALVPEGYLILSVNGIWPETRQHGFTDLWRWTLEGLTMDLRASGFEILAHGSMNPYSSIIQLLVLYIAQLRFLIPVFNYLGDILEKLRGKKGPQLHNYHVVLAKKVYPLTESDS